MPEFNSDENDQLLIHAFLYAAEKEIITLYTYVLEVFIDTDVDFRPTVNGNQNISFRTTIKLTARNKKQIQLEQP